MKNKDILTNNLNFDDEFKVDNSLKAKVNHSISSEALKTIIRMKNTSILNQIASSYDPHNIVDALDDLNDEDLLFFFKTVNSDDSAEIFTLLSQEKKEEVVQAFSSEELQDLIEEMQTDNLVDFVDELPSNLVNKVLQVTKKSDRKRIYKYLNFEEGSAGTLMTSEYLDIEENKTVGECLNKIRKIGQDKETIWKIFVVNDTRVLKGSITLDVLLENDENVLVSEIMNPEVVSVYTSTDEEVVLRQFRKYDISVLPVVNQQNRILGIITFDDIIDVANIENTEDIQLQAGVFPTTKPYLEVSAFSLFKSYSVWIVIMIFLDTFIAIAISYMQQPLLSIPVLITLLPSIMGTSGNSADQTSTVSIRELALYDLRGKKYWKFFFKEFKASLFTGLIVFIASFLWTYLELKTGIIGTKDYQTLEMFKIILTVSTTFFITIVLGKCIGVLIPKLAKKMHIDPAVITSPIVSTCIDIISILSFVLMGHFILNITLF